MSQGLEELRCALLLPHPSVPDLQVILAHGTGLWPKALGNVSGGEVIWSCHSNLGGSRYPAGACKETTHSEGEGQVWSPPWEDLAGYSR